VTPVIRTIFERDARGKSRSSVAPTALVSRITRHASRPSRGFTLPEVLAALVLIAVVLPAVVQGVSLALAACDDAKRKVEAAGLAETKLAEMTVETMQQLSSSGGSGDFSPLHPEYRWQAETVEADTDLTELTVRVAWTARGSERIVELSTFVFTGTSGTTSSSSAASGAGGGT
jgi:general secretion pathway protein I